MGYIKIVTAVATATADETFFLLPTANLLEVVSTSTTNVRFYYGPMNTSHDGATTLNSTLDVDAATTLNSTLDVDGAVTFNDVTDASSTTSASVQIDGGVGIVKNLRIGGDLFLSSDKIKIDCVNNSTLIFPSMMLHSVNEIHMSQENLEKRLGRYVITQFGVIDINSK